MDNRSWRQGPNGTAEVLANCQPIYATEKGTDGDCISLFVMAKSGAARDQVVVEHRSKWSTVLEFDEVADWSRGAR